MSNTAERFAIIPLYKNQPPPANAIAHGGMSAVMERIVDSNARNDAIDLIHDAAAAIGDLERTRAQEAQILARAVQTLSDSIDALARRMDSIEADHAAQAQADAEEEQRRIQDYLDSLPDPDAPNGPATYEPSGEMHTLPAATSDQGALPNKLREGAPPELGTDPELDPAKLAYPQRPKYQQMPAISLASEDDY